MSLTANPFFVLELPVTAGPREVEREAARLLGMLELGLAAAATYATPLGPQPRRAEDVRAAAAALRDPRRRLVAELWANGAMDPSPVDAAPPGASPALSANDASAASKGQAAAAATAGWAEALTATGWGRR